MMRMTMRLVIGYLPLQVVCLMLTYPPASLVNFGDAILVIPFKPRHPQPHGIFDIQLQGSASGFRDACEFTWEQYRVSGCSMGRRIMKCLYSGRPARSF